MATSNPRLARSSAAHRPIPRLAPVTIATLLTPAPPIAGLDDIGFPWGDLRRDGPQPYFGMISMAFTAGFSMTWPKPMLRTPSVRWTVKVLTNPLFAPPAVAYTSRLLSA